ncbi:uncharacterized protein LOC27208669 [Drosophila simulans]|nr:uncharacterized protein LOC27208669 [Drosophila simulans]
MNIPRKYSINFIYSITKYFIKIQIISRNDNTTPVLDEKYIRWTNINEEVDEVTPMIIFHLQKLRIEHFQLPDIKEYICIKPFFSTYKVGLYLTDGIVYNLRSIARNGNAFMTYQKKTFLCRFYLKIKKLQHEISFGGSDFGKSLPSRLIELELVEGFSEDGFRNRQSRRVRGIEQCCEKFSVGIRGACD